MKLLIIIFLIISNYISIVSIGKYKKISEDAIKQTRKAVKVGYKMKGIAEIFIKRFEHCVETNSKRKRNGK